MMQFDLATAKALLESFGGDDCDMTVEWCSEGHSGPGLYAYCTDYPEDGSNFLGLPDGSLWRLVAQATPRPATQEPADG